MTPQSRPESLKKKHTSETILTNDGVNEIFTIIDHVQSDKTLELLKPPSYFRKEFLIYQYRTLQGCLDPCK